MPVSSLWLKRSFTDSIAKCIAANKYQAFFRCDRIYLEMQNDAGQPVMPDIPIGKAVTHKEEQYGYMRGYIFV